MARPPLPLGQHGEISIAPKRGQWVARCRLRGFDGVTRKLERASRTRTAARQALQDELRRQRGERTEVLRPESRFRDAADVWMAKIRERRADSTAGHLRELPQEPGPAAARRAAPGRVRRRPPRRLLLAPGARSQGRQQADGTMVEKPALAANTRRMVRAIVGGIMQQAVLHQAVAANPVRDLERIESPKGHKKAPPRGLTAEERRRLLAYVDSDKTAIRADMPDLIRFAVGSGLRIGEICAVRWMDLDLDGLPVVGETDMRLVPVVAVRQNVYPSRARASSYTAARPLPRYGSCRYLSSS
jgi:integrase